MLLIVVNIIKYWNKRYIIIWNLRTCNLKTMKKPALACVRKRGKASLKLNKQKALSNINSELLCDVCGKGYKTQVGLIQHKKTHANDLKCSHCLQNFKSTECLQQHQGDAKKSSHQHLVDVNKWSCPNCQEVFLCRGLLETHQKCHKPSKKQGNVNRKNCAAKTDVRRTGQVHGNAKKSVQQQDKDGCKKSRTHQDQRTSLLCEVCGKSLNSVKGLQWHRKTHQGNNL